MGWDNERYPRKKKDTLHLSFISFGISHSRFSDSGISFLVLGYPRDIPRYPRTKKDTLHLSFISFGISHSRFSDSVISFLVLGYLRDIQKPQKIPLGYPALGHIPGLSLRYP
jgi:hypothetical protein